MADIRKQIILMKESRLLYLKEGGCGTQKTGVLGTEAGLETPAVQISDRIGNNRLYNIILQLGQSQLFAAHLQQFNPIGRLCDNIVLWKLRSYNQP